MTLKPYAIIKTNENVIIMLDIICIITKPLCEAIDH